MKQFMVDQALISALSPELAVKKVRESRGHEDSYYDFCYKFKCDDGFRIVWVK